MSNVRYQVPSGDRITIKNGILSVPENPIIPFIEGDGTGADIWRASVRVLDAAVAKALQEPTVKERLQQMGVVITASSPSDLDRFVKQEVDKWGKVVRDNNIQAGQ